MLLWNKIKRFLAWLLSSKNTKPPVTITPTPPVTAPPKSGLNIGDLGIDVSHHNGKLNWAKIAESGVKFVFIKATEGATFKDPRFIENMLGAKAVGIRAGAYHYFRPGVSPEAQAKNFLTELLKTGAPDLPPVLDWEQKGGHSSQNAEAMTWLDVVQRTTGLVPIIYTGPYFFRDDIGSPSWAAKYPLWIAHYTNKAPMIPPPWKECYIHQYTEHGALRHHPGKFDLNVIKS